MRKRHSLNATGHIGRMQIISSLRRQSFDTTLFNYAGHTQQKLVSRWGVGKHVRISYVCMDVLKINIFIYILHSISAIK